MELAGLHFGEIENFIDQMQQVDARAVNRAGVFEILVGERAAFVLAQHLGQHQEAVQRGAQLVGHVGQEFRFVFRQQGHLRRLLF